MIKSKKNKKDKEEQISKGNIKIRVFMRFGAEIRQKRAEYTATEKRDNYNNLIQINEKFGHNEDVDFSQEDVYSSMNITLGISDLNKNDAIDKIQKSIIKYEKRVQAIEKHPELNVLANYWDEKRKLREFKIYKNYLKNRSSRGAYFIIEDGIRVYNFESIDGFLIPIWQGADNLSDYPDFTRKKKITMQETANLESYFSSKDGKKLMLNALVIVLIVTTVLFCANLFWTFKNWSWHKDMVDEWQKPANYCAEQMASTYGTFSQLMKEATIKKYIDENNSTTNKQIQDKIKELNPLSG